MGPTRTPISFWLPLGVIAICALLILAPVSIPGFPSPITPLRTQRLILVMPTLSVPQPGALEPNGRNHFLPMLPPIIEARADEREVIIRTINLPALFSEMAISLPTTWPDSWHPETYSLFVWRSFAWPFYCLPFWYLVGRALDSLVLKRPLPTAVTIIGFFLSLIFLLVSLGLALTAVIPTEEKDSSIHVGIWLWTILFATVPIAWRQRRLQGR